MSEFIQIGWWQVTIATVFLFLAILISFTLKLGLEGSIILGGARTFLQLVFLGYVLDYVLDIRNATATIAVFTAMILVSALNAYLMEKPRRVSTFINFFLALAISFIVVALPISFLILRLKPWYHPQYLIPFGGMIIGNALTAGMLVQRTLLKLIEARKEIVETKLALGASYLQSAHPEFIEAIKTGMLPTINSLMIVGIVHIPGIFGGIMLAGVSPIYASKYQIVVMYMLALGAALTSYIVCFLKLRELFTKKHQLKMEEFK